MKLLICLETIFCLFILSGCQKSVEYAQWNQMDYYDSFQVSSKTSSDNL